MRIPQQAPVLKKEGLMMSKNTKDEIFLLKLYETAYNDTEKKIDPYAVARAIGQNTKKADNIVRHLAQANFIKKGKEKTVYFTPQGLDLARQLLKEQSFWSHDRKEKNIPD